MATYEIEDIHQLIQTIIKKKMSQDCAIAQMIPQLHDS